MMFYFCILKLPAIRFLVNFLPPSGILSKNYRKAESNSKGLSPLYLLNHTALGSLKGASALKLHVPQPLNSLCSCEHFHKFKGLIDIGVNGNLWAAL